MRTVRNLGELISKGYNQIRLVDVQEHELARCREKYPMLNIWSSPSSSVTYEILACGTRYNTATVVPSYLHKYAPLLDEDNVFICLELSGGL